jgi:hypothetical protein
MEGRKAKNPVLFDNAASGPPRLLALFEMTIPLGDVWLLPESCLIASEILLLNVFSTGLVPVEMGLSEEDFLCEVAYS